MKEFFSVKNLSVSVNNVPIVKDLNFNLKMGNISVLMGSNGSGKSTFAHAILGDPQYKIEKGDIIFKDKIINTYSPTKRAKLGIFLSFQNPVEIFGVNIGVFLHSAYKSIYKEDISIFEFMKNLRLIAKSINLKSAVFERSINEGLSGGEKKKMQLLEALILKPKLIIFDEIDSGLDVDSLSIITKKINEMKRAGSSIIIITHSTRVVNLLDIDDISIMKNGSIIKTGRKDLISYIEKNGFSKLKNV